MVRIGNSGIDQLGSAGVGSVGGAVQESRTSSTGSGQKSDSVSLSSAANLIELAKASAGSRQSKVQSLAADVKAGRYQASSLETSQSLVDDHISA